MQAIRNIKELSGYETCQPIKQKQNQNQHKTKQEILGIGVLLRLSNGLSILL